MPLPVATITALAALAASLAACTGASSQPSSNPSGTTAASSGHTTAASSRHAAPAGVGATHALHGDSDAQTLTVRLDQIRPSVTATDGKPPAGHRYFAAQLTITNTGTGRLDEGPWISTTVTDTAGQQYDPTVVIGITAGPELPGDIKAPRGASRTGWIVFDVPQSAKVTGLEYGASGGLGDTADWTF